MKKIYPSASDNLSTLTPSSEKPITQQQYEDLVERTNCAEAVAECANENTNCLRTELQSGLITNTIAANNITSTQVCTGDVTAVNGDITNLTSNVVNATTCVESPYVRADSVNTDCVHTDCVEANDAVVDCATIADASITNLTTDNITINCEFDINVLDACDATVEDLTATCASVDNATVDCATIDTLNNRSSFTTCAEITDATITKSQTTCADLTYITHTYEPQTITCNPEYWIVLPQFTNGSYYLEARSDGDIKLWSIEVDNSQANIRFKWSSNGIDFLKDVDIVDDETTGIQFLQIHVLAHGVAHKLYRQSQSLDNVLPPTIYSVSQYDNVGKHFDITEYAGTYIPNAVFAGDFHAESIEFDETIIDDISIACNVCTPTEKDILGKVVQWTKGNDGDYLTNVTDENNNNYIQWTSPATCVERGNNKIITSDAVSCYDGKVCVGVDLEDNPIYEYPIKELNCDTTVHGTITTDNAVVCKNLTTTNITDIAENVDESICAALCLNNPVRTSDDCEFKPIGTVEDGKPVVYNETDDVLETTDSISIDEATFDKITANCAYIQEAHIVKEEQEVATSDYLTLRANNDSALTSTEFSGLVINNFDGSNVAGIISDCTGTIRVGNGDKTDTTYIDIYYANDKWYSDAELTTEVTVDGTLTAWSSIEETEDYTHYTNAVFSKVDWSTTEPLLTRSEATSMSDNSLLKWDASGFCATTIAAPTCDKSTLAYDATNCCYYWQEKQPGSYIFNTMADYTAYAATNNIPDGSHIVIKCENDYLAGEEQQ